MPRAPQPVASRLAPAKMSASAVETKPMPVTMAPDWKATADWDIRTAADWKERLAWEAKVAAVIKEAATVLDVVMLASLCMITAALLTNVAAV